MKCGMTSVTFRNKSIEEITDIVARAGLEVIEWGGDVHCPFDNKKLIIEAAKKTKASGLSVSSYGSYFRLGVSDTSEFIAICEAAQLLGTDTVRIWAFNKSPYEVSEDEYKKCLEQAAELSVIAEKYSITVCFEYHRGTLTLNAPSAVKLINDIDKNNFRLYWQPNPDISHEENCKELLQVLPFVTNIHCFHWVNENGHNNKRLPLSLGFTQWQHYLNIADNRIKNIILEFTLDDDDDNFIADAKTLKKLI